LRSAQGLSFQTLSWEDDHLRLLDQTKLPGEVSYVDCRTVEQVWKAIRGLLVRGAPAIGIAAGYGLYLAIRNVETEQFTEFFQALEKAHGYLESSRPTGRNLKVILDRLRAAALRHQTKPVAEIKRLILEEAERAEAEDFELCESIANCGASLLQDGDGVMTHCNAGALATAGIGTALGIIYRAFWDKKRISVYATETRPVLQGARLTAWELERNGLSVKLVCEGAVAGLLREGNIQKILVGADRIVANGDTANKIGTYTIAILAAYHKIPFYVAAPTTTFDFTKKDGGEIPIEMRDADEVVHLGGARIAPANVEVYNPAFDVTPHHLITGIVTEKGVFGPPYERTLKELTGAP
jgi:methylthioribose-1-phosphate isomerase